MCVCVCVCYQFVHVCNNMFLMSFYAMDNRMHEIFCFPLHFNMAGFCHKSLSINVKTMPVAPSVFYHKCCHLAKYISASDFPIFRMLSQS